MSSRPKRTSRRRGTIIAVILVLLLLLTGSARFYTDLLWFHEVGFASVLWTSLRTQFFVGLAVGVFTAALVWLNLKLAEKLAPAYRPGTYIVGGRPDPMDQYRTAFTPFVHWIRLGIALAVGLITGIGASSSWQTVLLWVNRVPFGQTDPQFHKDIGFYIFQLPFLNQISSWIWFALMASLVLSLGAHYFFGAIRPEQGWRGVIPAALAHVSVLLGLLALVKAAQYLLGTYGLDFSARGVVTGASYTDVRAQLPALKLLALISVISAVLFLVNIRVRRLVLPLAAVAIWIFTAVLAGTAWPFVVQRFSVEPQEPQREGPYIARNLTATRDAYGLGDVQSEPYAATPRLTAADIKSNQGLLHNVRLWDPGVLQQAYGQLQAIRTYYKFDDVDIDRYMVNGEERQVLLSARELSLDEIESKSWQNLHLQYTHGFGLVASLANESTAAGQPRFLVSDVPPRPIPGAESLNPTEPRVYFGEGFQSNEYSVVKSKQPELDYALEEGQVKRSTYEGTGGIPVGNIFRRMAFAIREGDPNLVLSGLISSDSRILIYRNIRDRVRRAAPFLSYDSDPYLAVVDGRLDWIVDAYTSSRWYPYSQRFNASESVNSDQAAALSGSLNYVRNSVKVVVDAYNGTMAFHVVDPTDPLIRAWSKAFPDLFSKTPPSPDLQAHFRYPEDLFKLQSEVYRTYHMTDPLDFYSKQDQWDIPTTPVIGTFGTTEDTDLVSPVYLLLRLPGETQDEFVLTRPFTPRSRPNMVSSLIGRSDPGHYGQLVSLQFPRTINIPGPQQVDNLINQDVSISETLTLLNQRGSKIQFGSLVILPIGNSILYVQPLFVQAENVGNPELKKVALVLGQKVVLADNFDQALKDLLGSLEPPTPTPNPSVSPGPNPSPSPGGNGGGNPELDRIVAKAGNLYRQAKAALAAGDFAKYGALIDRIGTLLQRAQALSG
jgi:uncharacterized membrane protein (UPF0182 family)